MEVPCPAPECRSGGIAGREWELWDRVSGEHHKVGGRGGEAEEDIEVGAVAEGAATGWPWDDGLAAAGVDNRH